VCGSFASFVVRVNLGGGGGFFLQNKDSGEIYFWKIKKYFQYLFFIILHHSAIAFAGIFWRYPSKASRVFSCQIPPVFMR
jgi:hypothetical protein